MASARLFKFKTGSQSYVIGGLFIALFASIGVYLLTNSHAATPYISTSATSGTTGCNASVQSGAVKFGTGPSCGGGGGFTLGGGSNMLAGTIKGTDANSSQAADVATLGGFDRLDVTGGSDNGAVKRFSDAKVRVDLLIGSGDPSSWLNLYKSVCTATNVQANECPVVEVENEPDLNHVDSHVYAATVEADYKAFHSALGASSPAIVAAYEGSSNGGGSYTWGQSWWNWNPDSNSASTGYMKNYVDGVYVHPYGHHNQTSICSAPYNSLTLSTNTNCGVWDSALGDRGNVVQAHTDTGKPIYVTEVGWPTDNGTNSVPMNDSNIGDSYQWPRINCSSNPAPNAPSDGNLSGLCSGSGSSEGDQCNNVYNFFTWARKTGYVYDVTYFGYNDYGSGHTFYGLTDGGGNKKPAFYALAAFAKNQPNPCPNALTY